MSLATRLRRILNWADPIYPPAPLDRRRDETSRAKTPPAYRLPALRQGISGSRLQPSATRLLTDGFKGVQATASRAKANRLSDLELHVRRRVSEAGEETFEQEPDHPLQRLLDRPSQLLTRRQLLKLTSYWLSQTGEAFYLVVTQGAGRPAELWPMAPSHVEKVASASLPVSRFVFHGERGEQPYSLEEVIWIFDPDPSDPFQGLGVVGPQAQGFDAAAFASATIRSHFQNDATPKTVLKALEGATAPSKEQREAFYAEWQNSYNSRSGEQQGVPAFIPSYHDLIQLEGVSNLAPIVQFLEFERDQLLMASGVPRSILGDVVDANRAAADTNQLVFDRHTVSPQASMIADALTFQLAQPFYGADISVAFEDFVSGDEDLRLREERQDLELKVRTIDEVRASRDMEPSSWGDKPVGTFGEVPYTGEDPEIPEPDPMPPPLSPAEDEGDRPDEPPPATRSRAASNSRERIRDRFTPSAEWIRIVQRDAKFVPRMTSGVRKVFAAQKGLVIEALPRIVSEIDVSTSRAWSRADFFDDLFASDDFVRLFEVLIDPVRRDAVQASAEATLSALESRAPLNFDLEAERRMDQFGAELVQFANATSKRRIRETLTEGLREGDSIDSLAKRVRTVFNSASKGRARTIARTETLQAVQAGQLVGYRQSDVVERKVWNNAQDSKVRDFEIGAKTSHRIDGQTVDVSGSFTLGDGERADAPGLGVDGARLSPRNSINCRCFITPVVS